MSKRRWTMAEIQEAYENSKPAEFLSLGNLMKALAALPEPAREPSLQDAIVEGAKRIAERGHQMPEKLRPPTDEESKAFQAILAEREPSEGECEQEILEIIAKAEYEFEGGKTQEWDGLNETTKYNYLKAATYPYAALFRAGRLKLMAESASAKCERCLHLWDEGIEARDERARETLKAADEIAGKK